MSANHNPIFQSVFGNTWQQLPPVMHKHYANRPFSRDRVTAQGVMKIEMAPFMRLIAPFMKFSGVLVPYAGENIPTTVHFESCEKDASFSFNRIFHFPEKPPYHFRSRMIPAGNNEVTFRRGVVDPTWSKMDYHPFYILLCHYGIKVGHGYFLVANNHRGLDSIFADSPWVGGLWRLSLIKLTCARKYNPQHFPGSFTGSQRSVLVPVDYAFGDFKNGWRAEAMEEEELHHFSRAEHQSNQSY